jgi:type IV secretory pathway ATPase VirB11/archaellum biosynthesis ATPase
MSDNGHHNDDPPADISPIRPGRGGRPSYSVDALRETVERQFHAETADRADILHELDTEDKRRALLREIMEYVAALESISLTPHDQAALLDKAYRNLFGFGPLDTYLADDTVTEITINGPRRIHVRHHMGDLTRIDAAFDDRDQLASILARVLAPAGIALDEEPFLETGLQLADRPARLTLVGPPINPQYNLELRLHPRHPHTLAALHTRFHAVPPQAADLLRAILGAGHGLLIVGTAGMGKTTLAGALAHHLPADQAVSAVERAREMHLPDHITRRAVIPPGADDPGADFATQIAAALNDAPAWLLLDEMRGDESAAAWDALTRANAPRYLWTFRGSSMTKRLYSALSVVFRKHHPALPQIDIDRALAHHLPFVAALKRVDGAPRLHLIAEWVLADQGADYVPLALRPLISEQDGGWLVTENRPTRPLALPDDFWE